MISPGVLWLSAIVAFAVLVFATIMFLPRDTSDARPTRFW